MRTLLSTVVDSSIDDEIALETEAVERGVQRYRRLAEHAVRRGQGAALKPVERLMVGWFQHFLAAIKHERGGILRGEPEIGRAVYGPALLVLPPEQLAVIAMHEVLGACLAEPLGTNLARLAEAVGRSINAEANLPEIRKDDDAWDQLIHTDRKQLRPAAIQWVAHRHLPEETDWGRRVRTHLGARLIGLLLDVAFVEGDSAFESVLHRRNRKTYRLLRLSPLARQFIDEGHLIRQYLRPCYRPMVVPPLEWIEFDRGGYIELPSQFVRKTSRAHRQTLREADLSKVMDGVNALGATPWRINRKILGVVRELWDAGGEYAGIPRRNPIRKPPVPDDWDSNPDAKKKWKTEAAGVHRRNAMMLSHRVNFAHKLQVAEEFAGREAIWFPHSLDWRGRAYPIPLHLNHQGDDICRGLLEFAEGKPLDNRSRWWTKVHIANCCGVDKAPFEQRVAWVDDSVEMLAGWVDEPLANTGWMLVDKPFQALAAAMALIDGGPCHIPIQMDATCNALQHYAALGRNAVDAESVNLIPSDQPADVYSLIAERVADQVADDAENGNELAQLLNGHINRKVVKQTVMTSVYGVTMVGARRQVHERLRELNIDDDHLYGASRYLGNLTLETMRSICTSAAELMGWLAECARKIVKAGQPVRWTTPLGLIVEQPYRSRKRYATITTCLQQIYLAVEDQDVPPALRKQVNGFPPNFVHSLDSTHLLMTAVECRNVGIAFAGVHDSFWTHPADVDEMNELIRQTFVELHKQPIIEHLAAQFQEGYRGTSFPAPPAMGSLDINGALRSTYFCS